MSGRPPVDLHEAFEWLRAESLKGEGNHLAGALLLRLGKVEDQTRLLRDSVQSLRNHIVLHDDEGLMAHSTLIENADFALAATK